MNVGQAIVTLADAVAANDPQTGRHAQRVAGTARQLGLGLGLADADVVALHRGGLIHDVGKIGIPAATLNKEGPLNHSERTRMQAHSIIGESIAAAILSDGPLLSVIRHHHERFDGQGYPDGLRGSEIPLLARIISVCDAYDALASDRPYRSRISSSEAVAILREGAGDQWDPELVDVLAAEVAAVDGWRLGSHNGRMPEPRSVGEKAASGPGHS
jgi:putative two-component system response regulator